MAQTSMTVRMDNQQKALFDQLCEQFGMSANTAINIFVRTVIRTRSIPFAIKAEREDDVRESKSCIPKDESIRRIYQAYPLYTSIRASSAKRDLFILAAMDSVGV